MGENDEGSFNLEASSRFASVCLHPDRIFGPDARSSRRETSWQRCAIIQPEQTPRPVCASGLEIRYLYFPGRLRSALVPLQYGSKNKEPGLSEQSSSSGF
jgi:hypothetical protein